MKKWECLTGRRGPAEPGGNRPRNVSSTCTLPTSADLHPLLFTSSFQLSLTPSFDEWPWTAVRVATFNGFCNHSDLSAVNRSLRVSLSYGEKQHKHYQRISPSLRPLLMQSSGWHMFKWKITLVLSPVVWTMSSSEFVNAVMACHIQGKAGKLNGVNGEGSSCRR